MAAALLGVQVAGILALSLFYGVELAQGRGSDQARVLMSIVTFLVGAGCLALLVKALWGGAAWPRTPTVLWNVLLLIIAVTLAQAGQWLMAALLGTVSAAAVVAVVLAARRTSRTD